jgi:hypothetical protein
LSGKGPRLHPPTHVAFPSSGMLYHPAEFGRCAAQLRSGTLKESVQSSAGSQEGSHRNDSSAVVSRGWNTRKRTVKRARSPATARRSGSRAHTPGTTPSGASVVRATARPDHRDRLPRPRPAPRHLQRLQALGDDRQRRRPRQRGAGRPRRPSARWRSSGRGCARSTP